MNQKLTRLLGRSKLVTGKYSPEILVGVGVISVVAGTVMACKATLRLEEHVLNEHNETLELIEQTKDLSATYSEKDEAHDKLVLSVQTGVNIVKHYAPSAMLITLGISSIIGSHGIMRRRNAALTLSYVGIEKAFKSYRKRVAEELGDEREFELRHDIVTEKVKVDELNEETGKTRKVTKEVKVVDGNGYSVYARFFDELNVNWTHHPERNLLFLKAQQTYMNDLLHARGHVLLNDVYDAIGIDRTSAGAIVGWVVSEDGDNFIDFGIYDLPRSSRFVNGTEHSVLLDFNVDGVIYDKIA